MMENNLEKVAEKIALEWNEALKNNDIDRFVRLYAPDAVVESPLIPHLLNQENGICTGTVELRKLIEVVAKRKPLVRKYYKNRYFTDGKTIMWEYPRQTPSGEQMDFVEVMEINNGLIQYHKVYWGWYGFNIIKNDDYKC